MIPKRLRGYSRSLNSRLRGVATLRTVAIVIVAFSLHAGAVEGARITLYEDDNFAGARFSTDRSVADLARVGFNDRASSVDVRDGPWLLCSDANFGGNCVTLQPGTYRSLGAIGLNDRVSSVRQVSAPAAADPSAPGGSIVLYEQPGLTGRSITIDRPVADFATMGFNDRARSAYVNGGAWQLCSDARFSGNCNVFRPGRWDDLGAVTGDVSSARTLGEPAAGPGGVQGVRPGGAQGERARVVMFEGQGFSGRSFVIDSDVVANFGATGFNDRASSLRVERGTWLFCSEADFFGECRSFGPGEYANLPASLNNRISSGRRIANDAGIGTPPRR